MQVIGDAGAAGGAEVHADVHPVGMERLAQQRRGARRVSITA